MPFDLAAMARQQGRRRSTTFRDIVPPRNLADELYRQVYAPVVAVWVRRAPSIMAEYTRTLAAITMDSAADLNRELDAAGSEVNRLLFVLQPVLREWALRVERWQRGRWIGAAVAASGIDLTTMIGPAGVRDTVEAVIERNVGLIKDVSAQARARISTAVFDGVRNRTPAREVAKGVREATSMARARSVRIASDQMTKLTSALASERRREAGLDIFEHKHSGKLHAREDHRRRDGKLYSETASEIGRTVEGKTVAQAAEPGDRAGIPPFCGCRELAVLVLD